jgi:hypothetical protein
MPKDRKSNPIALGQDQRQMLGLPFSDPGITLQTRKKMKKLIYLLTLLASTCFAWATGPNMLPPVTAWVQMETYSFVPLSAETSLTPLSMEYGSVNWLNKDAMEQLAGRQIVQIDLVYTRFPTHNTAQQKALNERRMRALLTEMPALATQPGVWWCWVEQTGCSSEEEAEALFHGFVIHHTSVGVSASQADAFKERVNKAVEEGRYSAFVDSSAMWMMSPEQFDRYVREHNLVGEVMRRHPEWKRKLVVQDVTGSMMPYYEQMVVWHALGGPRANVEGYLFFNDGDTRPDDQKVVGKTGGLYFTAANDMDLVIATLLGAAMAGSGGDAPENNVEALLEGIRRCPKAEEVILIADNWATPRDLALIEKVGKPVRVILCGAYMGVNPAYLNLAMDTGGSIHTIDEDLNNLIKLKEGDEVKVMGSKFRIEGGQFVPVE